MFIKRSLISRIVSNIYLFHKIYNNTKWITLYYYFSAISGNKYNMIMVTMPRKVLDCRALTRTISFTSIDRIDHLKMRHRELVSVSTKIILIFF